jgi:DNA-binding protein HU-beta
VNKAELIDALTTRIGDKSAAVEALDAVLTEIQHAVTKGHKVNITGFGSFEKRNRAARTARNPRTGEVVKVKKTSVPAFKAGATFRELVASGKVPKAVGAKKIAANSTSMNGTKAIGATGTARTTVRKATKNSTVAGPTGSIGSTGRSAKVAPAKKTAVTQKAAAGQKATAGQNQPAKAAKATQPVKAAKATQPVKAARANKSTGRGTYAKAAPVKKSLPSVKPSAKAAAPSATRRSRTIVTAKSTAVKSTTAKKASARQR